MIKNLRAYCLILFLNITPLLRAQSPPVAGFIVNSHSLGVLTPQGAFDLLITDASSGATSHYYEILSNFGSSTMPSPFITATIPGLGIYTIRQIVTNNFGADTMDIPYDFACGTTTPALFWYPSMVQTAAGNNSYVITAEANDNSTKDVDIRQVGGTWAQFCTQVQSCTVQVPVPGPYEVCSRYYMGTCTGAQVNVCDTFYVPCWGPPSAGFGYTFGNGNIVVFADSSVVYGPATYSWDFGDGYTSNQVYPSHNYLNSGTYNVCMTVSDSCGTDTICSTLQVGTVGAGQQASLPEVSMEVFPNPVSGPFSILLETQVGGTAQFRLHDVFGTLVQSWKEKVGIGKNRINPKIALGRGIYFLEAEIGSWKTQGKLLVR